MAITDIIISVILGLFVIFGAIKGFTRRFAGWASFFGGIISAYYLAPVIVNLFVDMDFYAEWQVSMGDWARIVLLIICFIGCFLIIFLVLKLIFLFINKAVEGSRVLSFFNHFLGAIAGLLIGLFFVTVMLLIAYGLSSIVGSFRTIFFEDIKYGEEGFTLSKFLLEFTFDLFESIKSDGEATADVDGTAETLELVSEEISGVLHGFFAKTGFLENVLYLE